MGSPRRWPNPWPKITATVNDYSDPRTGVYTEYTRGSSVLEIENFSERTVVAGDSLSAYSMILYGNYKEIEVWGRYKQGVSYPTSLADLEPISDLDLIHVGEVLVHGGMLLDSMTPGPQPKKPPKLGFRPPPDVKLPRGMEIVAADRFDGAGWSEYITTFPGGGYVILQDIPTFVFGVHAAIGARPISILHIQVHGSPGTMYFGDWTNGGDILNVSSFPKHRVTLQKLSPHFANDAWVVVRSCKTGQDRELLRQLGQLWGVNIFAGTGDWRNALDFNDGKYVVIERDGTEYYTRKMPDQIQSSLARRAWKNW